MVGRVALITGANAGIGLALAERLLQSEPDIRLCLACRNAARAAAAREALLIGRADADITLITMDTSSVVSVVEAAKEVKKMYGHLDLVYLNAGIMPSPSVDWMAVIKNLFSSRAVQMFRTGAGILVQREGHTSDGLQQTFATNLFGHFVLVRELGEVLGGSRDTQIVWTSSVNAHPQLFSFDDIQHKHGSQPYASSKYATDLLSVGLNKRLNNQGIYSHSTCPGLVMTNLTHGILPAWIWTILFPIFYFFRLFAPSTNLTPYNGSEALLWLSTQAPASLDPMCKYQSRSRVTGTTYVVPMKMGVTEEDSDRLYKQLEQLEVDIKRKHGL